MDWLISTSLAAVVSTLIWYIRNPGDRYKLGLLSLIFWGAAVMIFIDHLVGYILERGEFLEMTGEAGVIGLSLIVTALVIWVIALLLSDPKKIWRKR